MESSLNLNTLENSLPSTQNAEKELLNNFKAAALSITTLYRSSRQASKRAFNAGYASACNDILLMIQQGVSVEGLQHNHASSGSRSNTGSSSSASLSDAEGQGMTIGKVMDWIEARMEAIRSREEEEDEEEEREKEKERERANPNVAGPATANASLSKLAPGSKASNNNRPTRDQGPAQPSNHASDLPSQSQSDSQPASPSPPPTTLRQAQRSHNKSSRTQAQSKGDCSIPDPQVPPLDGSFLPNSTTFNFVPADHSAFPSMTSSSPVSAVSPFSPLPDNVSAAAAGAKRRHAVMMMLDSSSASPSLSSNGSSSSTPNASPALAHAGSRRRTRSGRSNNQNLGLNLGLASEAMDVEEDGGRERKRVARR